MPLKNRSGIPKQPKPAKWVRLKAGDAAADCQGKITIQKRLRATVPLSPKFAISPAVGTTFTAWSAVTDKAEVLHQSIIDAESTIEQMYTSLSVLMLQYKLARDGFLVAAENVCENEDDARAFGLLPAADAKRLDAEAPDTLHFVFGDVVGDVTVRWPRVPGAGAYIAEQSSVDPPTDASWVKCYMGKSPSFKMTGLTLGQKLSFRVMSIGRTLSAWSAPTSVVVR
jgi:hypothetical protein